MRKILKRLMICLFLTLFCAAAGLTAERQALSESLIRFHVVANSDSERDQQIKLKVRDAVLSSIQSDLQKVADIGAAKAYILESLPQIREAANEALKALGIDQSAVVTLRREAFDVRHYDTFSLPAGVYESLRIVIGEGEGHNWWCVTYPALCLPAAAEGFEAVAADSGLSETLTDTLSHRGNRQLRFFFLDKLGELQNRILTGK